jgi:hypothetical protein
MSNQTGALAPPTPSQLASYNMPAPPTNTDNDNSPESMAEDSSANQEVDPSDTAELVPDAAGVMADGGEGGGSNFSEYNLNEMSLLNQQPTNKTASEPMDMAFRLLKRRRDV